jgi:hypothetical protein
MDRHSVVLGKREMSGALAKFVDYVRGSGEYSVSVPPFDGALRPNEIIEAGELFATAHEPDNLILTPAGAVFSSGESLLLLEKLRGANTETPTVLLQRYPSAVTAMAAHGESLAVGLEGGGILIRGGPFDGGSYPSFDGKPVNCPTALAFQDAKTLIIANGSSHHSPIGWKQDLMEGNSSGSVWQLDLASGRPRRLAAGLAYPYGLLPLADGAILVSESWRHRILRVAGNDSPQPVLANLPAYPSRICRCARGGAWVAMFAPRRRLVEFVLREPAFRKRMMTEISSDYWIAPTLAPMASFLEPLQGGTLKQLARLKPWAPSRSYGLIIRIDEKFQPVESLHSRADGTRHGMRSVLETPEGVLAASAGANAIVLIAPGKGA